MCRSPVFPPRSAPLDGLSNLHPKCWSQNLLIPKSAPQRATNQPKNNLGRPRPLLAPNLSQNLYHPPTDLNWARNCHEENCDRQSIKKYLIIISRESKNENMTNYLSACRLGPPFNFKWNPMSALGFSFNSVDRASANDPSWLSLISLSIWYHHSQTHTIILKLI